MKKIICLGLFFIGSIINVFPQCAVTIDSVNQDCGGDCFGQIFASASGTPPFNYSWSNGGMLSYTMTACADSTYTLTITDAIGCTASTVNTMTPHMVITIATINATCAGCCDGSATAIVTGGCPPYHYQWSSGDINNPSLNLCAGAYSVYVTDSCGCSFQGTGSVFYLTGINDLSFSESITVSPNPSEEEVTLGFNKEAHYYISLQNVIGEILFQKADIFSEIKLDVSGLEKGIYFVTVRGENKNRAVRKIIKM